eukprot:TRINITY_DN13625_c0_g1_i1.p1 TRINITY_DN13625_c0_g1~~TRINITY_DN13625_c0_g1_i1.p1  ORF type:complete len:407 (+),score=80.71 TRINITY_DN13625_c0_g1_i1:136-1356(+)
MEICQAQPLAEATRNAAPPAASSTAAAVEHVAPQALPMGSPTTLQLRNVPNKYTQPKLMDEINQSGFEGSYDYLYLPTGSNVHSNIGYAFLNFRNAESAERFRTAFTSYVFKRYRSNRLGTVQVARVQGLTQNLLQFAQRPTSGSKKEQYRPIVLDDQGRKMGFDAAVAKARADAGLPPLSDDMTEADASGRLALLLRPSFPGRYPVLTTVCDVVELLRRELTGAVDSVVACTPDVVARACQRPRCMAKFALVHAAAGSGKARAALSDAKVQATAVSAAGGAVAMGLSGGATGFVAGGSVGTAVGLVPALFTFGLSVPFCAAFGSGLGVCIGTTMGASFGAVSGGAAGYSIYVRRDELKSGSSRAWERVSDCTCYVKTKAHASASYVTDHLRLGLLAGGGTGGTGC